MPDRLVNSHPRNRTCQDCGATDGMKLQNNALFTAYTFVRSAVRRSRYRQSGSSSLDQLTLATSRALLFATVVTFWFGTRVLGRVGDGAAKAH